MMRNRKQTWTSTLVLFVSIISIPIYYYMFMGIDDVTEISKCPLCFGKNMCNFFQNDFFHLWIYLLNIFLPSKKLVFFKSYDGVTVVLKKPPRNLLTQFYNDPKITDILIRNTDISGLLKAAYSPGNTADIKRFILCPSYEKLETLYLPLLKGASIEKHQIRDEFLHLVFMISINIEPLIQQVIKDWAVAEYLGSCGSIYISKYCGESLTQSFPKLNWSQRSQIAIQLLEFALNATFKHPDFSFYFTDLTPDNFSVDLDGYVRLIDLEDVIVVDRRPTDLPPDWNTTHENLHDDSVNGFVFSHQEICSHHISDLNIYAICQGILSEKSDLLKGGLLQTPPSQMKNIKALISDCISSPAGISRFDIAHTIIDSLHVQIDNV